MNPTKGLAACVKGMRASDTLYAFLDDLYYVRGAAPSAALKTCVSRSQRPKESGVEEQVLRRLQESLSCSKVATDTGFMVFHAHGIHRFCPPLAF